MYDGFSSDPDHIKRERRKAQELRKSSWWKQQIGRGLCYHCGGKFSKELLTMDHLVPIARGGKSTKNNCVVSCKDCNTKKGYLLPVELTFKEMEAQGEFARLHEGEEGESESESGALKQESPNSDDEGAES
jgi:5-methylcytosine-specific restriction protein A